ncbi:MAG: LapA family protein [Actinomycetota bacterium]
MGDESASGEYKEKFTDQDVAIGDTQVPVKVIIAVAILIGVLFFVFQNTEPIPLEWLFFDFTMPLWILSLVLFGSGVLIGWALHIRRTKKKNRKK